MAAARATAPTLAVRVSRLSGQLLELEVEPLCTVHQLAHEVAKRWQLPATAVRLAQGSRLLSEEDVVGDLPSDQVAAVVVPVSEYGLGTGDSCETLHPVTVRESETFDSAVLAELREGTPLEVLDIGEGRRLLVSGGGAQGWISYKTRRNEPLVARRVPTKAILCDFEIGMQYELSRRVRLVVGTSNPEEVRLAPGTRVLLLEVSPAIQGEVDDNARRARVVVSGGKVSDELGTEGWVSLADIRGSRPLRSIVLPGRSETVFAWAVPARRSVMSFLRHMMAMQAVR